MLVNYGYVPDQSSKADRVVIRLAMNRDRFFSPRLNKLYELKILPQGGGPKGTAFYKGSLPKDGSPAQDMWAVARVLSCKTIKTIEAMKEDWLRSPPSIGKKDLKAAKWLSK